MAYRNCVVSIVTVALACVVLNGCATVKKLAPWGESNSDANAATPVESRDGSETGSAVEVTKTISVDDRDLLSSTKLSSDESTKPVDLAVPRDERDQAAIADPPQSNSATVEVPAKKVADAPAAQPENTNSSSSTSADEWGRAVQQAIHSRWVQPRGPNIPTEFSCDVMVKLTPFGGVDDVKVVRSCGDVALDASIETAVRESSPLPTPKDPADFSETLMLTFTPR